MRGESIGTPGGSLRDASWAVSQRAARVGRAAETRTGEVLADLAHAEGGPTVLHDLDVPVRGSRANIDHVVVAGTTVLIVDSKAWKPGFYWSALGRSFRGVSRFAPAEKGTMGFLRDALARHLGDRATVVEPVVAVWPSSGDAAPRLWALRVPSARVVRATRLRRAVRRALPRKPADPRVVAALARLVRH